MRCPDEMKIEMLLNGVLSAGDAASVKKHVAVCRRCRAIYDKMKCVDDIMRGAAPEPPEEYWRLLPEKLREKSISGRRDTAHIISTVMSKTFWGLTEAAAAVIIISMISLFSSLAGAEMPDSSATTDSYSVWPFTVAQRERISPEYGFSTLDRDVLNNGGEIFTR